MLSFLMALMVVASASAGPMADGWAAADADVVACFEAMDRDPALAVVNAKFARREPTAEQRANQTVVTDEEADQLRLRIVKTRPCRELRLAAVKQYRPLLEPSYRILYYQADQVFTYLINKWISYGEANRLSWLAQLQFQVRSSLFDQASEDQRADLSRDWDEMLQRAHSNPPPANTPAKCDWEALVLACQCRLRPLR